MSNLPTFAFVGRVVSEKGIPVLIQAAKILAEQGHAFRVDIVGDGPELPALKNLVADYALGDCVTFTGALQGEALRSALNDCVAVIMPSVWEETAGLVAIENMIAGRLVIASRIGGLEEIVGDAGLLVRAFDPADLADKMLLAMQDPALHSSLTWYAGERARRIFAVDRMVDDHAHMFEEVSIAPRIQ